MNKDNHKRQNKKIKCSSFFLIHLAAGCTVVWWFALSPHSKKFPGVNPGWDLSVWNLHVLPVHMWVLSCFFSFLPMSQNMHVRLIGVPN